MLFLPVLSYLVAIMGIGYHEHWFTFANLAFLFVVLVCIVSAGWYLYSLQRQVNSLRNKMEAAIAAQSGLLLYHNS